MAPRFLKILHPCSSPIFNLQYRFLGSEGHTCLQQQNVEDKVVSGYHSWKICPDTRPERHVRIPELENVRTPEMENMSRHQSWKTRLNTRAGRYVWLQYPKDMSGYQSWKTCPDIRATARGPELQSTLPVDSPFLPESLLYPYHRQ